MLTSLALTNWKSFGEDRNRLQLSPLTLLVGPNASGKSNALDALRFLQGVALDFPLADVLRGRWEGQREVWPAVRGQVFEAARNPLSQFRLETQWRSPAEHLELVDISHAISVDTDGEVVLQQERVATVNNKYAIDTHAAGLKDATGLQPGSAIRVAIRAKGKGNSEARTYTATRSLLGQVEPGGRADPLAISAAQRVRKQLRDVAFLDIQPGRMRDYKPEHAQSLGTSGEHISPLLKSLPAHTLADIVDWLGELCAPNLTGISFDSTKLKEVMFFLQEAPGTAVSARSVSDGTLRFLGLVTALLTAPQGSLIVLEEPDVGLHPARIHLLASLLEQVTRPGGIQVIATTHSPTLLSHLQPESLGNVLALGRGPAGATECARLADLPHFERLRDSAELEHLVSTGWIERAL